MGKTMPPVAVVMNLFYTGLGIARSLGEKGIPVIGLTAQHGVYGNFTRYAKTAFAPDSRNEPEALLAYLLKLGQATGCRAVLFPTRDDDLLFLDRFRANLNEFFSLVMPDSTVLKASLNKWETYGWAQKAGVPAPKCWLITREEELVGILDELVYPCVLKPLAAHHWRRADNWTIVGSRKAIAISSREELLAEYTSISRADTRALVQELVAGGDDCLFTTACYLDRESNWVAGFTTQKLLQVPEGFGTGCIVQAVSRPELFVPTLRLLQTMRFTGIAEVEYKWAASKGQYQLIEINPRAWDQHRLGKSCGTDLAYLAYCEHAGLPRAILANHSYGQKWIAEDAFAMTALRLLWQRDPNFKTLFRLARGKRLYGIWSANDMAPFLSYSVRFLCAVIWRVVRHASFGLVRRLDMLLPEKRDKYVF